MIELDKSLAANGRWDELIAAWTAYLERNPTDARAYHERSGTRFHSGDKEGAKVDALLGCMTGDRSACSWHKRLRDATKPKTD